MEWNGLIDLSKSVDKASGNLLYQVLHKGVAFPTSPTPKAGQVFYRTDETKFYIYDGTQWTEVTGSGGGTLPTGTHGDLMYHNGTDWVALSSGTSGEVLQTNGSGSAPSWVSQSGSASYKDTFDDTDLSSGILTINHGLGQLEVFASIFDNNNRSVDLEVTLSSTTACTVDLSDFAPITGTWRYIVNA